MTQIYHKDTSVSLNIKEHSQPTTLHDRNSYDELARLTTEWSKYMFREDVCLGHGTHTCSSRNVVGIRVVVIVEWVVVWQRDANGRSSIGSNRKSGVE